MLANNHVHGSDAFEDTRMFLGSKGLSLEIPNGSGRAADKQFQSTVNALYAGRFYIAYMRYGADVEITAPAERGDYNISFPLVGGMASSTNDDMIDCTARRTVLASPGRPQRILLGGHTERLSLSLQQEAVRKRLAILTGGQVTGDVLFEPIIDLSCGVGQVIASNMQLVAAEEDKGIGVFTNDLRVAHFEEMVLSTLLLYHPHNCSGLLDRPHAAPASRDVKRVADYMHAHLDMPLMLEDLVGVAGVPGRTLNEHFRRFTGHPPMAYLRMLRLQAARRALISGDVGSVTDAASQFGFFHMGRFSKAYSETYGETPSHTLNHGRTVGLRQV